MEQGFPSDAPWREVPIGVIVWHIVMLALGVAALVGVIRSGRRTAKKRDAWLWGTGFLISGFAFIATGEASIHDTIRFESRPFVFGYIVFVGLVCALSAIISHVRLRRSERGSHAMLVLFSLLGLGVLIFLSLPQVPMAREAARRSQCRNNLKQIGLAMHNFEDVFKVLPRASVGNPPVSWRVALLPYLDGKQVFDQYDQSLPWDATENESVARIMRSELMCPSRRLPWKDSRERHYTDYVILTGPGTVSPLDRDVSRRDFVDGSTNTAMVAEATGLHVVWTEPRDFDTTRQPIGINLKGKESKDSPGIMSSYHRAGGHLLMGDGKVRFVNEKIDPRILKKLTTIDGGEKFDEDF